MKCGLGALGRAPFILGNAAGLPLEAFGLSVCVASVWVVDLEVPLTRGLEEAGLARFEGGGGSFSGEAGRLVGRDAGLLVALDVAGLEVGLGFSAAALDAGFVDPARAERLGGMESEENDCRYKYSFGSSAMTR